MLRAFVLIVTVTLFPGITIALILLTMRACVSIRVRKVKPMNTEDSVDDKMDARRYRTSSHYRKGQHPTTLSDKMLNCEARLHKENFQMNTNICYDTNSATTLECNSAAATNDDEDNVYDDVIAISNVANDTRDTTSVSALIVSGQFLNKHENDSAKHTAAAEYEEAVVMNTCDTYTNSQELPRQQSMEPQADSINVADRSNQAIITAEEDSIYDDIDVLQSGSPTYENVDPVSGLPVKPHGQHNAAAATLCDDESSFHDQPERAVLPLKLKATVRRTDPQLTLQSAVEDGRKNSKKDSNVICKREPLYANKAAAT